MRQPQQSTPVATSWGMIGNPYRCEPRENRPVDVESELRPLPPPRCRGIPIGDGNYTGCAYGYGDVPPFTAPVDCPVCNGSGFEGSITGSPVCRVDAIISWFSVSKCFPRHTR